MKLLGSATAVPENYFTTDELIEACNALFTESYVDSLKAMGVGSRYSVIANYKQILSNAGQYTTAFSDSATSLGRRAAVECMETSSSDEIGLLIAATNTQTQILPGLASKLMAGMHEYLDPSISHINMQGQGCSCLFKAFEVADWYLKSNPRRKVLIVASEVQTPYGQNLKNNGRIQDFKSLKKLSLSSEALAEQMNHTLRTTQCMLFGDAATAFLVGTGEGFNIDSIVHLTNADPEDADLLQIKEGGTGFPYFNGIPEYKMEKEVPAKGAHYVGATVDKLFGHGASKVKHAKDADFSFIHTGSRKILDKVCDTLDLSTDSPKVGPSYEILDHYGNVSSCSIGLMLHNEKPSGTGFVVSFGVGFSATSAMLSITAPSPNQQKSAA